MNRILSTSYIKLYLPSIITFEIPGNSHVFVLWSALTLSFAAPPILSPKFRMRISIIIHSSDSNGLDPQVSRV